MLQTFVISMKLYEVVVDRKNLLDIGIKLVKILARIICSSLKNTEKERLVLFVKGSAQEYKICQFREKFDRKISYNFFNWNFPESKINGSQS